MLTGPLLSMLHFICVEGRKKKEKPAKTKAEFLLQLFETINEPRCDVVGCFFLLFIFFSFLFLISSSNFVISQSWQREGPFSRLGAVPQWLTAARCTLFTRVQNLLVPRCFPRAAWLSLCAGLSFRDGHGNLSLQSQHLSYWIREPAVQSRSACYVTTVT